MSSKLIISDFYHGHLFGFQITDERLEKIIDMENNYIGNIYCGYVRDVVKNLNAAFVEFDDKKGYLPLDKDSSLKQGDKVLVQVSFDAMKSKDYGLTTKIDISGEFAVLTSGKTTISISKKINDEALRNQLKQLLMPLSNDGYGFILRTKCADASMDEITSEVEDLIHRWEDIQKRFEHAVPKEKIYGGEKYVSKAKEFFDKTSGEIITDRQDIYDVLKQNDVKVALYDAERTVSLSNLYKLGKYIEEAKNKMLHMKSGASLYIEPTEALTVIDVNTGKADIRTNREAMFVKINHEAAGEIARQLEIRNISGIIIIDFINMNDDSEYEKLEKMLKNTLSFQSVQCMVMGFTKLGLMELSRKKTDKPLHEILCSIEAG